MQRFGRDLQSVGPLFDLGAELAQLGGQGRDAIGLFVADVPYVANRRRTFRKQGHGTQGLHCIADGVHIDVDAVQWFSGHGDLRVAVDDLAAHLPQAIAKGHVALKAIAGQALDGYTAAGDGCGGEEITGRRGIGFDGVGAAVIGLRCRHAEGRILRQRTSTPKSRITASVIAT